MYRPGILHDLYATRRIIDTPPPLLPRQSSCSPLVLLGKGGPLVVSVAIGYELPVYWRFVGSLRKHFAGAIALLTKGPPHQDIFRFCCRKRASVITSAKARALGLTESPLSYTFASAKGHAHDSIFARFSALARLCSSGEHSLCLGIDFRDVFFQANPFARPTHSPSPDLGLTLEGDRTIGSSRINRQWVRTCFDDETAERLSHVGVVNSGAIIGSRRGLAALGGFYESHAERVWRNGSARNLSSMGGLCNDQALLNVAVHAPAAAGWRRGLRVEVQTQGASFATTLCTFKHREPELRMSDDGLVLNSDGSPTPAVHQFDRLRHTRFGVLQDVWQYVKS